MKPQRIETFAEFWPYYLRAHRLPATRTWHFGATNLLMVAVLIAVVTGQLWMLPFAVVAAYGMAWYSHFFIERNKPATFGYPIWSIGADLKLWVLTWTGRIQGELDRHLV